MYFGSYPYAIGGAVISALSSIEIACWDVMGKFLNVPVWKLLGGTCQDRIRVYAHGAPRTHRG